MAIVQISRITQRKGLQENLPQLAGAEFGWSVDQRRLFIGNGTLEEGAPVIGNTEILTEFSDILAFQTTYTYKGEAAGYVVQTGPGAGTPVTQSLQSWLDQFATVKDFGAVGDGVTDDTAAINRALFQLYCRQVNPQIRRSLFFPAGVYRISQSIIIPPYATLYGEGPDNSIIQMSAGDDSSLRAYVARTGDSLQQFGTNIGTNGATPPQYITISNMGFQTADEQVGGFMVQNATNCAFNNVAFIGPFSLATIRDNTSLVTNADISAVNFASTSSFVTTDISFHECQFGVLTTETLDGSVYGGWTSAVNVLQQVRGINISDSEFNVLYQGVSLGDGTVVDGGPTGVKILNNTFDNIYDRGIVFGDVQLNASGYNIFYNVGNELTSVTQPYGPIIEFLNNNNVSIGDMFQRADVNSITKQSGTSWPRIEINNTTSIGLTNSSQLAMGTMVVGSGQRAILDYNNTSPTTIQNQDGVDLEIDLTVAKAFVMTYTIVRDTAIRTGTLTVTSGVSSATYMDDYVENTTTDITLSAVQAAGQLAVKYSFGTAVAPTATITYSITYLA